MSDHAERRRFERIAFDAPTDLSQNGKCWTVELVDISFKGFLIEKPPDWDGDRNALFQAAIRLSPEVVIHMDVKLAHEESDHLGFQCRCIRLDSMDHLRKIVELNLHSSTKWARQLRELIEV